VEFADQRVLQLHIRLLLECPEGTHVALLTEVLEAQFNDLQLAQRVVVLHARTGVHGVVLAVQLDVPDAEVERRTPGEQGHDLEVQYGQVLRTVFGQAAQVEYFRYVVVFQASKGDTLYKDFPSPG